MNKAEVMEKIQPLVQGTLRHVRDPRNTKVLVADNMVTLRTAKGANLLQVAPEGAKAMVSYAGIPLNIAKMLSPGTFGQVLSEVLDQKELLQPGYERGCGDRPATLLRPNLCSPGASAQCH